MGETARYSGGTDGKVGPKLENSYLYREIRSTTILGELYLGLHKNNTKMTYPDLPKNNTLFLENDVSKNRDRTFSVIRTFPKVGTGQDRME